MATEKSRPIKITLVGPESTGKSSLCVELSKYFKGTFVTEYARTYLKEIKRPYTKQDVLNIHQKQMELECLAEQKTSTVLFCDTSPIVSKVWLEEKYKCRDVQIERDFEAQHYDLFLLCVPDLVWEPDPLRENENDRPRLFSIYENLLSQHHKPFELVSGSGAARILNAIAAIEKNYPTIKNL